MASSDQIPIKKRLVLFIQIIQAGLKQQIEQIRGQNFENKNILVETQKQIKILEKKLEDPFKVVNDYFVLARESIRVNYEKDSHLYEEQTDFLQDQIESMTDDKIKATQNILILEEKLKTLGQDVGM